MVSKPNVILHDFQDRIEAPNPVKANAWLAGIHICSVRHVRRRAEAKFDRRPQCRGFALMVSSFGDGSRVTRTLSSKANFPQKWLWAIKSSKPSSVCSIVNLTTSCWASAGINARFACRRAGSVAFLMQHRSSSAEWS